MRGRDRAWALLLLLPAACAGGTGQHPAGAGHAPVSDAQVKIGPPYSAGGNRYVPADDRYYDAVGMASWYGAESGTQTANGERLDANAWSAAHPTLPLPSYVEVTALASGRTIVVRINDRGPFARDRLIDLSAGAARALGIARDGGGAVRVRRVFPSEAERAALRAGQPGGMRPDASPQLLAALRAKLGAGAGRPVLLAAGPMPDPAAMAAANPAFAREPAAPEPPPMAGDVSAGSRTGPDADLRPKPGPRPRTASRPSPAPAVAASAKPGAAAPRAGGAHLYVQIGAFGDAARARQLAGRLGGEVSGAGRLSRVRLGPFADAAAARDALAKVRARGYAGAAIVRE